MELIELIIVIVLGLFAFTAWTAHRVERALPAMGRFVEVGGHRVHYLDQGSGPTLLLVHGLAGQAGNFTHSLVERLTDAFRVIVIDRPGSGWSVRARGARAGLRAQAAVVAGVIDALALDRPLLIGHSLGGGIGLAVAHDFPQAIRGLALIAPLTHSEEHPPAPFKGLWVREPFVREAIGWTLAVPMAMLQRDRLLPAIFAPEPVPTDFATRGGGLLGLRPSAYIGASEDLVAAPEDLPEMVARYADIPVPVAVLYGAEDALLNPQKHGGGLKAAHPATELTVVPGGHMILITQPDLTADWLKGFARRVFSPAS